MSSLPTFRVRAEVAFTTNPNDAVPAFQDISAYLLASGSDAVQITRGRTTEFEEVQPSTMSMVLDNADGRFTPGRSSSPYYPNVRKGKRCRITVREVNQTTGDPTTAGNMLSANAASMETDSSDWTGASGTTGLAGTATVANSGVRAQAGSKSTLVTWPTAASAGVLTLLSGFVIGRTYTLSMYAYVSSGTPDVQAFVKIPGGAILATGSSMSTKTAFTRFSVTFTAAQTSYYVGMRTAASSTSGQQVWLDSVMCDEGSTPGTFTTTAPAIYYRFDGFVQQWPMNWVGGPAASARAQVTAVDRLARLARLEHLESVILETLPSLSAVGSLAGYWPLSESQSPADQVWSAGAEPDLTQQTWGPGSVPVEWAQGAAPPVVGLPAPVFGVGPNVDDASWIGGYLARRRNTSSDSFSVVAHFKTANPIIGTNRWTIVSLVNDNTRTGFHVSLLYDGIRQRLHVAQYLDDDSTGAGVYSANTTAFNDGLDHVVIVAVNSSLATPTMTIYIDGVSLTTVNLVAGVTPKIPDFDQLHVGGVTRTPGRATYMMPGVVSNVMLFNAVLGAPDVAILTNAYLNGFTGETSDQRLTRIATYVPGLSMSLETGATPLLSYQKVLDATALDLMRKVVETEAGLLFMSTTGVLTFQARSHRYNIASPAFTLDSGNAEVEDDLAFVEDDFGMVNDITVTRQPSGLTTRIINQPAIDAFDRYEGSVETLYTTANDSYDAGAWRVQTYGSPLTRCPHVGIDLLTQPAKIAGIAGIELISAKFRISNLPASAPSSTVDLFCEGYSETIGLDAWNIDINASPAFVGNVWVLDSASFSQLDSTTRLAF